MSCLEMDDDEVIKIAEPMMDDIMLGISRRDYKLHSGHHSVSLKSTQSADAFLEQCTLQSEQWGRPGTRELLAIFRKQKSFTLIWDQHYSDTPDQVLAIVTVALKGGRYFVDFFLLH